MIVGFGFYKNVNDIHALITTLCITKLLVCIFTAQILIETERCPDYCQERKEGRKI